MAANKLAGTGKKKRSKHEIAYDKAYNHRPEEIKQRDEVNAANRKAGTDGKMTAMGMDRSHTKDGKLVLEKRSTNRARNGKNGKSTKK